MKTRLKPGLPLLAALFLLPTLAHAGRFSAAFDKAALEKMVADLSLYIPQQEGLQYPIVCEVTADKEINAAAYCTAPAKAGGKPIAHMEVNTGFLKWLDKICGGNAVVGLDPTDPARTIRLREGDQARILRAVVAHEMAHLSCGHVLTGTYKPNDLNLIYTREKEYEADAVGAAALQRGGYSRQDMQDTLAALSLLGDDSPSAARLLADHADGKRRAAAVANDPRVLRSLIEFDLGEAFADGRNYGMATRAFIRAGEREPRLVQAFINAAQSQLMDYYQQLPANIRDSWYRPDFGPLLNPFRQASRQAAPSDADRARYAEAQRLGVIALRKAPNDVRTLEVLGLLGVLHPDGDPTQVSAGIANLQKALTQTTEASDRLRLANNLAVGFGRQAQYVKAAETIMEVQRTTQTYNAAVARNLAMNDYPPSLAKDANLASAVLFTFLSRSPSTTGGYALAAKQYKAINAKYAIAARDYAPKGVLLNPVLSITNGADELALFDALPDVDKKLGAGDVTFGFSTDGKIVPGQAVGVFEKRYRGGNILVLCQSRGEETPRVLRVTDFTPGAKLTFRPVDSGSSSVYTITVGQAATTIPKEFGMDLLPKKQFVRVGRVEEWLYSEDLHFGIAITDGKVSGITVTPSKG